MRICAGILTLAAKIGTKILPVLLKSIKTLKIGKSGLAICAVKKIMIEYIFEE